MKKHVRNLLGILLMTVVASCTTHTEPLVTKTIVTLKKKDREILKEKPANLAFVETNKEPIVQNLHMIGTVGKWGVDGDMGKILRTLRYQNIADAVEARYKWIPKGTILAMIAQETGGADALPNGLNDGGVGNIHMQGPTASEFGLNTYGDSACDCTKMACKKDGLALLKLIKKNNYNKKKLVQYDDRFNPILNLDAVGRMLSYHKLGPKLPGFNSYQTAICRYSGSYNYRSYSAGLKKYMRLLTNKKYLAKVEKRFNKMNPKLLINGTRADFKMYIESCQSQNINYGLKSYMQMCCFSL